MKRLVLGAALVSGTLLLLASANTLVGQTPDKKQQGYWSLVDVTTWATPDNQVLEYYPARITGTRGNLESLYSALDDHKRVVAHQKARWRWADPPATLVPGQKLSFRLTCELLENDVPVRDLSGYISVDFSKLGQAPGTRAVKRFYVDKTEKYTLDVRRDTPVQTLTEDFVGEVPDYDLMEKMPDGSRMTSLRVEVNHGRTMVFYYNYRWVAGTPPSSGTASPPGGPTGTPGGKTPGGAVPPPGGSTAGPGQNKPAGTGNEPGAGTPAEPATVTQMTLQAGKRRVPAGQVVTVPIWLLKAQAVANMNFTVSYDPAVAKTTGAFAKGNLLDKALFEVNPKEAGVTRVGFAGNNDLSGDGTVVQLTFAATGAVGTRTPLRLTVTTIAGASGAKPTIATIDGEILVVGPDGNIPGDADGDGQLTARDAGDALKMSVKLIPINMVCDVDKDGQVTSTDARLILAKATGKP